MLIGLSQDKSLRPLYDFCVLESTRATRDPYSLTTMFVMVLTLRQLAC
jgi:hypothetical protein